MLAYAAHEGRMRAPADKEGRVSARAALETMLERGGRAAEVAAQELAGPEVPEPLAYLWDWFVEMDRTRTSGVNGPDPLTYPIIESWSRLTGRSPSPLEVETILFLDVVVRHPDAMKEAA